MPAIRKISPVRSLIFAAGTLAAAAALGEARAERIDEAVALDNGMTIRLAVIRPDDLDPNRRYPAILAFPGAAQNARMVDADLRRFWQAEAERRGVLIFMPEAPRQGLFFAGGAAAFPELLEYIAETYPVDRSDWHVAGISNGGRSALHIAAQHTEYFKSATGLPGILPTSDHDRASALAEICVRLFVGENDRGWVSGAETTAGVIRAAGGEARVTIEPGQGHIMMSLAGDGAARLFDAILDDPECNGD